MLLVDEEMRIEMVSKEARELLGFSEKDFKEQKRSFRDLVYFEDFQDFENLCQTTKLDKLPHEQYLTLVNSNGQRIETISRVRTVPSEKRFLIYLMDVT
ncbi:MAG: PAS domain-containing protein, partial [Pseudothermotoga sp.]